MMSSPRMSSFKYQVLVTASLFFGLFFIEYPPLFLVGYWSWTPTVAFVAHKTISGVFIILNLFITQYAVRRWGFFRRAPSVEGEKTQGAVSQAGPSPEENK
jgi:hypothetical protein